MTELIDKINKLVNGKLDFAYQTFKKIHAFPETGWNLPVTSKLIQTILKNNEIKFELVEDVGIIGIIKGDKPGKCVLLRADMDALPIKEMTNLPYQSTNGNMHACGHDGHTTTLLTAILILNQLKSEIKGSVKFMFQPDEECDCGMKRMLNANVLKNPKVDYALAIHCGTGDDKFKEGDVVARKGAAFASIADFKIYIQGNGGHISRPNKAINPLYPASEIINEVKKVEMELAKKKSWNVLGIGGVNPDSQKGNVIPNNVMLAGSIRTVDPNSQKVLKEKLTSIVNKIKKTTKAKITLKWTLNYPASMNDDKVLNIVLKSSKEIVKSNPTILATDKIMGGEDFAFVACQVPSCMYHIQLDKNSFWHNATMKINPEKYFPNAIKTMVYSTISLLKSNF
ncbi:MAG: amidohydrolase [Mycoplasmataceae bacterium]|nr:amidohydrolase [Mycoplasmataceae bacterium]